MITILDSSSQRINQLLIALLNTKEWLTIKTLSEQLSVSEKTINDDIAMIQETYHSILDLEVSTIKGIRATDLTITTLFDLQARILQDAVPIKFLTALFYHPNESLHYYADKLHVSRSTLYRYLPKLNTYLESFSMKIINTNSIYHLSSEKEITLRRFFSTLFLELSGYHSKKFIPNEQMLFLGNRIRDSYSANHEQISKLQVHFYISLYFVSIQRELQGFYLDSSHMFSGKIPLFNQQQIESFNHHFGSLTLDDMYRIEKSFLILRHSLNHSTDRHLETTIPHFLESIFLTFQIKKNEQTYQELLDYLKDLYLSDKIVSVPFHIFNNRFTFFSQEINNDNPYVYTKITQMIQQLNVDTTVNFNLNIDYIFYILVTLQPDIMLVTLEKRILGLSNYSKNHAEFLFNIIQNQLNISSNHFKHVECNSIESLANYDLDNYHLIITNTQFDTPRKDVIVINDFPSDEDIYDIKKLILK